MSKIVEVVQHPILKHKLSFLRDESTSSQEFRAILCEVSKFLAYEATKNLETEKRKIKTPLVETQSDFIAKPPVIVSILRAGSGMLEGLLSTLPYCSAGHIGIYRDKFIKNTVEYYFKMPKDIEGKDVLLADPLLATGDTAVACIDRLKQYSVGKIKMLTVLTSPQGIEKVHHFHPDVDIFTLSTDPELNENGYLVPGIGDAGDRLFGTL